MLVGTKTDRIDIPHEEGEWVELRRLAFLEMDEALEENNTKQVNSMKKMGAELVKAIMSTNQDISDKRKKRELTVDNYDLETLIRKSCMAWSYVFDADSPDGKQKKGQGVPCNEQTIKQLDGKTAQWLGKEIFEANREETAAERLDATSPSTAT